VFEAVRTSGLHEYFDPFDGTGRGSAAFGWTAALAIDMEVSADSPGGTD
jgi:hypothetical protein